MDRALGDGAPPRGGGGGGGRRGGRGGRGGYRGRGGGGQDRKRPREEPDPDGSKGMLSRIFHLCDRQKGQEGNYDAEVEDMATKLMRDRDMLPIALEAIVDCAVEVPVKVQFYAALVGLMNSNDEGFGARIVEAAHADFVSCAQKGLKHRSRLLLRFLTALVVCNVVQAQSLVGLLADLVSTAKAAAASGTGGDGRLWQMWADHVVYSALVALPWAGSALEEAVPEELSALLSTTEKYLGMRPKKFSTALMPFYGGSADHEDLCLRNDSGAASFLGRLWEAIQELKGSGWAMEAIPKVHDAFESQLAEAKAHPLPQASLPTTPPCVEPEMDEITAASAVATMFGPRGGISLLPEGADGSGDGRPIIERIVVEEYILDTLYWFDGDRRETAVRLGNLPVPFKYEAILMETLLGQLLCLPTPPRKPVGYLTIMVDCMKTIDKFSKPLSGCVRELFGHMEVLDPELQARLAEWLAYHLSCFDFQWPWARWTHVLDKPCSDSQRRFCCAVISRMLRLSYYDRVKDSLPAEFTPIIAPKPEPQSLDQPMADVLGSEPMAEGGAEEERCKEMLGMVRGKVPAEEMMQWIQDQKLMEELGGVCGVLSMVLRTLLVAGSKSFTHMLIALERYVDLLQVWLKSPQRAAIAIDRLMGMRLVQGSSVVRWIFDSRGMTSVDDELAKGLAWEALVNCTNKMIARAGDEKDDLAAINTALIEARRMADVAAAAFEDDDSMDEGTANLRSKEAEQAKEGVTQLEQTLAQKVVAVGEADSLRDAHILNVYRGFVGLLDPQLHADESGDEDHPAWVDGALGSFRAFTRSYHVTVAPVASEVLEDVLREGKAHPLLRNTFIETLQI